MYSSLFNFWHNLRTGVNFALNIWQNFSLKLSSHGLVCWKVFVFTDWIPLLLFGLFIFYISFSFSLQRLYVSRNVFLLGYSFFWSIVCSNILWFFFISVVSVVTSLSFLIFFIWALSFLLMSLATGSSILFILLKNQLLSFHWSLFWSFSFFF